MRPLPDLRGRPHPDTGNCSKDAFRVGGGQPHGLLESSGTPSGPLDYSSASLLDAGGQPFPARNGSPLLRSRRNEQVGRRTAPVTVAAGRWFAEPANQVRPGPSRLDSGDDLLQCRSGEGLEHRTTARDPPPGKLSPGLHETPVLRPRGEPRAVVRGAEQFGHAVESHMTARPPSTPFDDALARLRNDVDEGGSFGGPRGPPDAPVPGEPQRRIRPSAAQGRQSQLDVDALPGRPPAHSFHHGGILPRCRGTGVGRRS